jgi:predicted lipid-binding transport protein (Tim44 family)
MNLAALFEIVIFGIIAFVLITKLIDMLGVTDESDLTKDKSYFGEPKVRNITASVEEKDQQKLKTKAGFIDNMLGYIKSASVYEDLIVGDNLQDKLKIIQTLTSLTKNIKGFDPFKFVSSAKGAFELTLKAVKSSDIKTLEYLVDKRFLSEIQSSTYASLSENIKLYSAKISEVYSFGNSVLIKMLFELEHIDGFKKTTNDKEEWVFIKNVLDYNNQAWQISSISAA